jgi:hypothetical protein
MLFYILQQNYFKKHCIFSKIYYHTKFQDLILNDGIGVTTSQVCMAAMLLLLTVALAEAKDILLASASSPALGPTQPPT